MRQGRTCRFAAWGCANNGFSFILTIEDSDPRGRDGGAVHRHYEAAVEAYAQRWRENPVEQVRLTRHGRFGSTTDGACLVALDDGHRCFLKPRPEGPNPLMVAREKIASDLGFDLGLPVAPVLVRPPCPTWPQLSSLSLVCLPSTRGWGHGGQEHVGRAVATLESLRAFWTWIADTDHEGHHENLLYEVHGEALKFVAIDHGRSLGHGMTGGPLAFPASLGYGTADLAGAEAARRALTAKIQGLSDPELGAVVQRLEAFLSTADQGLILDLLRQRRDGLQDLLMG